MKLIIDIPEQIYLNAKANILCGGEILVKAIKNGIPNETVTEFADRCRECGAKYGKLLKQEISGDLISKQDAIDAVKTRITYAKVIDCNGNEYNLFESENSELEKAIRNIEALPPVNPQEQTGHWIDTGSGQECSECHEIQYGYDSNRKYCANCGCRMVEPQESEVE